MGKRKYVFDKDSFDVDRDERKIRRTAMTVLKLFAVSICLTVLYYAFFALFFSTDRERALKNENRMLERMYPEMEKKAEEPKPVVRPVVKPAAPAAKPAAQPAAQPAPAAGGSGRGVKSPLPGVILDVKVKVGDAVKKGQTVVILEAMKMENNINADQDGTITAINVKQGDSVLEGTDLVMIG